MELHTRFMEFTGERSSVFNIIENSAALVESIELVIGNYVEESFADIKPGNEFKKKLDFFRLLLCQLYKFNFERATKVKIKPSFEFNVLVNFLKNSDPSKDKEIQSILYDVITLYLILLVDQRNLADLFKDFQIKHSEEPKDLSSKEDKLSMDKYLKILNCFLSTWKICNFLHIVKNLGNMNALESCKEILLPSILYDLQNMELEYYEQIEWHALHSILSKIVSISQSTKVLIPYIDVILKKNVSSATLCGLSDFIFPHKSLSKDPDYCLIHNENLMKIIQDHLHIGCPQKRKEAVYLVKKLIEFVEAHEETLIGIHLEVCMKLNNYNVRTDNVNPFICNNKTATNVLSIKQVRTNFVLVMEALEEKQKHLVTPYFPLIETLIKAVTDHNSCGDCFGVSWLYCVFARILEHHNSAIVKWGLLRVLKISAICSSESFLMLIINTLNKTYLYDEKSCDQNESNVTSALVTWFRELAKMHGAQMIETFMCYSSRVQWGPVPIFYVLQSLYNASPEFDNILQWEEGALQSIKTLVSQNIILHPPTLRSMSHVRLIQILCNTSRIGELGNLISFLAVFPKEDLEKPDSIAALKLCLVNIEYSKVETFVKSVCDDLKNDDQQVIISMSIFSLVIHALYQIDIVRLNRKCRITKEIKALLLCLDKIGVRPYIRLSLITKIMDFVNGFFCWDCNFFDYMTSMFDAYKDTVFKFILKLFHNEALNYHDIDIYQNTLKDIFYIYEKNAKSKALGEKCAEVIEHAHKHSITQILFALKLWSNNFQHRLYDDKSFLCWVRNILAIAKSHKDKITGKAGSDFYTSLSKIIKNHVSTLKLSELQANPQLFDILVSIVDAAGNEVLIYVSDVAKAYSVKINEDDEKLEGFKFMIKCFWTCNFASKRDKTFWLVAQKLTDCINSSQFTHTPSLCNVSKDFIYQMSKEGKSLPGLKYILLTCSDVVRNFNNFTEVLLDGLLHGQVPRRDQRIQMQACMSGKEILGRYALKDKKLENFNAREFLNKQWNVDAAVRCAAVVKLCAALKSDRKNADVLLPLVLKKLSDVQDKRYFADSPLHKLKHRIMQTLLILQPCLDQESTKCLYHVLTDSILLDTDQHSVRLMKEWLLINLYLSNQNLTADLWQFFDRVYRDRPNSLSSLITIIWHLAGHLADENYERYITTALLKLSYCCTGQQYNMRLYGQLYFNNIYQILKFDSKIAQNYYCLFKANAKSLSSDELQRNASKIVDNFFCSVFNPELHYSLETIYHQLPRLSNASFEELIVREDFEQQVSLTQSEIDIRINNRDKELEEAVIPQYKYLAENSKPEEIESYDDVIYDVQKKITPWRTKLPNENEIDEMMSLLSLDPESPKPTKDIIVVASLVDKPRNLGGIARTCEIFGVKELVISNLKKIEEIEFKALSVSADKWIKMTEAKESLLRQYLIEMKNNGWTLVGAEQTANSVTLSDYKFPEQTVLVLGNEKTGIPANIIPLLDECVEIPQYGVIRSLNVHVTGAICIWEYNKQHQVMP